MDEVAWGWDAENASSVDVAARATVGDVAAGKVQGREDEQEGVENVVSVDARPGGKGREERKWRTTAVDKATGQPRPCLRGHGRPHGVSPWTWPRGRLRGMSLQPRPWRLEKESGAAAADEAKRWAQWMSPPWT